MFEKYQNDIDNFCQVFNANDIEELRPNWCEGVKSTISTNSLKLIAICVWRAINIIRATAVHHDFKYYENFVNTEAELDEIKSYIVISNNRSRTPFFDSGYQGIALKDVHGNKFYFMINDGNVGLEDQYEATATIGSTNDTPIKLTHDSRKYGDVGMHDSDADINVNIIVNKLVDRFYQN